jgi:hypothetical protein
MKKFALSCVAVTMLAGAAAVLTAQDAKPDSAPLPPGLAAPAAEHAWLKQSVGEWETEGEVMVGPGATMKCKGTETVRAVGEFWTIAESKTTVMEMPMHGVFTLGYDPQTKKYVGTWVDSMTDYMWHYTGTVDATGKKLTLDTEGPNPAAPGTKAKFKEVLEITDKDHRVFTSSMQGDDGKWLTFVTIKSTRKK